MAVCGVRCAMCGGTCAVAAQPAQGCVAVSVAFADLRAMCTGGIVQRQCAFGILCDFTG